jgi:hypothetical protein
MPPTFANGKICYLEIPSSASTSNPVTRDQMSSGMADFDRSGV